MFQPVPIQSRTGLKAALASAAVLLAMSIPASDVDFSREIKPLLSDRCFNCHGPDEAGRKADLRLDTFEGATRKLDDDLWGIRPGAPEQSEVVRRIFTDDPDDIMPPPDSHLTLTQQEREAIRQWISDGAEYAEHWAFVPVGEVTNPDSSLKNWGRNPIDAFVLDRLEAEGLQPQPEASKEMLIRRASLDLTGLPPNPSEIDAFIDDSATDAYERLVDRLLDAPSYGEARALDWLDLARFADTFGYQADVGIDMSPWRDWVIQSFNKNLPYDDFIRWQIAGDLLPDATPETMLATAFNRLHRQTNEGGSIDEEFRVEYVSDRVHTMGTAFLGLTYECARCHDHKYDPISQKDYYAMSAFFNSIDESGLYSHFTRATPTPTMFLYESDEQREKHALLKKQIKQKEAEWRRLAQKDTHLRAGASAKPNDAFSFDEVEDDRSQSDVSGNTAQFMESPELADGRSGKAVRFSGDNSVVCKNVGEFTRVDPFTITLWLKRTKEQDRAVVLHRSRAWSDSGSRGYELVLQDGRPFFGLIHFWPGNAIAIRGVDKLPMNEWAHVALTYDGSSQAAGLSIHVNGKQAETETVRDNLYLDIVHRSEWGDMEAGGIHLTLGGRFRDSGLINGSIDDLRVYSRTLNSAEIRADRDHSADELMEKTGGSINQAGGVLTKISAELQNLRIQENDLANRLREIMVMRETPEQRPTYVLTRGAYDAHGAPVEPDTSVGIFPFGDSRPSNRLGLADWLTDRQNPLVARVAANRAWKQHFGNGLVGTAEDFGNQGRAPTHPELLDWLAGWFMENGWDLKGLHRLIATSATYRQSSQAPSDLLARDPGNTLLARGPRNRLTAEAIRDSALAASGLLHREIGGPSVKPYQPPGLWKESGTGKTYVPDKGDKLYRRSLYTFRRRTAPPPSMLAFDGSSHEVCTARREVTSTPLQSLVLMNDPQFLEAARVLAEHTIRTHGEDVSGRIVEGFRRLTGRQPDAKEKAILEDLQSAQLQEFSSDPDAAEKLVEIGEHPRDEGIPIPDLAATTMVFSALMNFDEFIVKR